MITYRTITTPSITSSYRTTLQETYVLIIPTESDADVGSPLTELPVTRLTDKERGRRRKSSREDSLLFLSSSLISALLRHNQWLTTPFNGIVQPTAAILHNDPTLLTLVSHYPVGAGRQRGKRQDDERLDCNLTSVLWSTQLMNTDRDNAVEGCYVGKKRNKGKGG